MAETSLYKPAADLSTSAPPLKNDQEGTATVSPTGAPVIPPGAVPFLLAGVGIMQIVEEEFSNPGPWDVVRVFRVAVKVGSFLALGASPGWRKPGRASPSVQ